MYDELRRIASRHLRRQRDGHTLCTTALVHEAHLKLADSTRVPYAGDVHFFRVASRAMRQVAGDPPHAFPEGHVRTAAALTGLGRLLLAEGRPAEAEAALAEALDIRTRGATRDEGRTAETRTELGAAVAAQGRNAEAERLLLQSRRALAALYGAGGAHGARRHQDDTIM